MFNTDSVVFQTLTENEVSQIPNYIFSKIKLEVQNQNTLYKTHNEINLKKIEEYKKIIKEKEILFENQCKEKKQLELKYCILFTEHKIYESKIESYRSEVMFLRNNYQQLVNLYKKNKVLEGSIKVNSTDCEEEYKNKKKEIDSIFQKINQKKSIEDSSDSTLDFEKKNKRLREKINDLKKQVDYLLNSNNKKRESLEGKKKLELIKIIQSITIENEELKKNKITEDEFNSLKEDLNKKNDRINDLEHEKKNLLDLFKNLENKNKMLEEYLFAIDEKYRRIFEDKQNIYEELSNAYKNNIEMENKINELKEEIEIKNTEILSLRSDLSLFKVTTDKLEEVTLELKKVNDKDKEKRLKIQELSKKLEESEDKYNKYILSNKSDILAILGNELSFINKKIDKYVENFLEISQVYVVFKEEQDKLACIYKHRNEEYKILVDENKNLKRSLEVYKNVMLQINLLSDGIQVRQGDLYRDMFFIYEIVDEMSNTNKRIIECWKNMSYMYRSEVFNKENIIRSLVEGSNDLASKLLKSENEMLKKEISYLRNKIDNMESDEIEELRDKVNKYKTETDSLREYINNLSVEVYDKNQELKAYENNLTQLVSESEKKDKLIKKYQLVVEKLRIIKDEYVKMKSEIKKKKALEDQENTNSCKEDFKTNDES